MNDSPKAYSLDPAPWNTTPVAIAPRERTIYNYYLKNMVLVNSCTPTYINYSVESDMSVTKKKLEKTAMKPPQEIVPQEMTNSSLITGAVVHQPSWNYASGNSILAYPAVFEHVLHANRHAH